VLHVEPRQAPPPLPSGPCICVYTRRLFLSRVKVYTLIGPCDPTVTLLKTLAIISQKGGVSKTTLATALAVAAQGHGQNAAVFDLDPQASASFWHDTREAPTPAVTAVPSSRLSHLLRAAQGSGCDLAIIDAPPFAKDIAFEAAQHADFILIPARPAVLDVMAMTKTLALVRYYGKPAAVVLTFCPPAGRELSDTEEAVHKLGALLCPVRIGNRIAFSRAQQTGLAAQEYEPGGKAAEEIERLYEYTRIQLNEVTYDHRPETSAQRLTGRA
jgi:chromosome partitioning protein